MHGYVDSFPVPMHLPSNLSKVQSHNKGKGKEKEVPWLQYNVTEKWTSQERDDVERKVAFAVELGYSTVLLTIQITPTTNPSILRFPTPLLPDKDPRTAAHGEEGLILQLWKIEVVDYGEDAVKAVADKGTYGFSNSTAPLFPPHTSLLSVSPISLGAFSHVCLSLSPPSFFAPTLITVDPSLSTRLPFPLKRGLVSTLQRSGCMIEIILRGLFRQDDKNLPPGSAGGSSTRRRNWISGTREIVRAMGGKNIILSSGALKAGELRGTEDLINLCVSLCGFTVSQAKDALSANPRRAILRGLTMRQTYRGVISNPTLVTTKSTSLADFVTGVPTDQDKSKVDQDESMKRKGAEPLPDAEHVNAKKSRR